MAVRTSDRKAIARLFEKIVPKLKCYMDEERVLKSILTVSLYVGCALFVIYCARNGLTIYKCAALMLGHFATVFYILFLFIILRADNLHHVRVHKSRHSSTYSLFVPMEVDNDRNREIHSISDVIGLCGSHTEKIANSVMFTMCGMFTACVITRILEENAPFNVEYMFAIGCPVGMWLVNAWSVNSDCSCEKVMHLMGAGLYVWSAVICFGIQQNWNSLHQGLALIITSSGFLFCSFWISLQVFELKQYISTYYQSVILLLLECVLIGTCNLCNCLYLYNM